MGRADVAADGIPHLGCLPNFLNRPGEMPRLIADHDWSATLGPIEDWPVSLKTTVGLLINSPVPIVLLWGADGVMIYNDAYSVFAGGRASASTGQQGAGRLARGRRLQRQRHEGRIGGGHVGL